MVKRRPGDPTSDKRTEVRAAISSNAMSFPRQTQKGKGGLIKNLTHSYFLFLLDTLVLFWLPCIRRRRLSESQADWCTASSRWRLYGLGLFWLVAVSRGSLLALTKEKKVAAVFIMSNQGGTAAPASPPPAAAGDAGIQKGITTKRASSAGSSMSRKMRANTWSDAELEDLYDIKNMSAETAQRTKHLLGVLKAIRHCNKAKRLEDAIKVIVNNTCQILGCDRATLFIVDPARDELVIRKAVGVEDVRVSLGTKSIAGSVYHSGIKANIPDAYKDERFNSEVDVKTGYHTKSILSAPIWDANYEPVAVLQAVNKIRSATGADGDDDNDEINKNGGGKAMRFLRGLAKPRRASNAAASTNDEKDGSNSTDTANAGNQGEYSEEDFVPFTTEDEVLMDHLSLQLGVILRNHVLREESERAHTQVLSMLDIVKSLHSNMGINSLMFTITERSPSLVDADRCTLYVVDRKHGELWSMQGAIEIRVPIDKGLAGATASTGETINIEDAHDDPRFNTEFDKKTGFRTKQVLVMPICNTPIDGTGEDEVVGVLQVINKLHGQRFTEEDEGLLRSFLDIVGGLIQSSNLFVGNNSNMPKLTEFGAAQDLLSSQVSPKRKNSAQQNRQHFPDMIAEAAEGDEEDDEDEEGDS